MTLILGSILILWAFCEAMTLDRSKGAPVVKLGQGDYEWWA